LPPLDGLAEKRVACSSSSSSQASTLDVDLACFCWAAASGGGCDVVFVGVPFIIVTALTQVGAASNGVSMTCRERAGGSKRHCRLLMAGLQKEWLAAAAAAAIQAH
jgi:hypothetical protein